MTRQGVRYLPNNARPILAYNFQYAYSTDWRFGFRPVRVHDYSQASRTQGLQVCHKLTLFLGADLNPQDSRELAPKAGHSAFEPVTPMRRNQISNRFNQSRPILTNDCH